jgi:nucleotide-binding universal stress UspA family protein
MYKKVVVPLDGSELAEHALPHAAAIAKGVGATLHLVRVFDMSTLAAGAVPIADPTLAAAAVSSGVYEQALEAERGKAEDYLKDVAARIKGDVDKLEYSVQQGPTVDLLVSLVEQLPADLVVMTTRGESGLKRFVFGSVTNDLLHRLEIPVLVVPNIED